MVFVVLPLSHLLDQIFSSSMQRAPKSTESCFRHGIKKVIVIFVLSYTSAKYKLGIARDISYDIRFFFLSLHLKILSFFCFCHGIKKKKVFSDLTIVTNLTVLTIVFVIASSHLTISSFLRISSLYLTILRKKTSELGNFISELQEK